MYRTWVILRHTFRESLAQPIFTLLLALAGTILLVFTLLPYFTLGEDTIMYKSVGLDVVLLFVLLSTLFTTSRSIYEEIEDRTMLTLMSKPVAKWEVLLGKYLGIILSALLGVAILGAILGVGLWWRIPGDYQLTARAIDDRVVSQVVDLRAMHLAGLLPSLMLVWMQVSVLAAISVALSVRFSLVVNLPIVILLYVAGNLTRFLFPLQDDAATLLKAVSHTIASVVPFLQVFDFRAVTLYRQISVAGTRYADPAIFPHAISVGTLWTYVGVAALYGVGYVTFALACGLLMFQSRELGGAEG